MATSGKTVICDLCRAAINVLRSEGWAVHPANGGDYCPTCASMAAGRN